MMKERDNKLCGKWSWNFCFAKRKRNPSRVSSSLYAVYVSSVSHNWALCILCLSQSNQLEDEQSDTVSFLRGSDRFFSFKLQIRKLIPITKMAKMYYILRYISGKQTEKCMLTIIIGWLIFYIFLIGCSFLMVLIFSICLTYFFPLYFFLAKR